MTIHPAILSLAVLLVGASLSWLIYGRTLLEFHRNGDYHGRDVTAIAMFATFLPTLVVMGVPWSYM